MVQYENAIKLLNNKKYASYRRTGRARLEALAKDYSETKAGGLAKDTIEKLGPEK